MLCIPAPGLVTMATNVMSEHHSWDGGSQLLSPLSEDPEAEPLVGLASSKPLLVWDQCAHATDIPLLPTLSHAWQGHLTWLLRGGEAALQRAPQGAGVRGGSCECPGRGGRSGG